IWSRGAAPPKDLKVFLQPPGCRQRAGRSSVSMQRGKVARPDPGLLQYLRASCPVQRQAFALPQIMAADDVRMPEETIAGEHRHGHRMQGLGAAARCTQD